LIYFAYGSNMHRARLEQRVGTVVVVGAGALAHYRHEFAKLGVDGTAKGTIVAARDEVVHGVLYRLDASQLDQLVELEGGYRRIEVAVGGHRAATFEALRLVTGLRPTDEYLEHYFAGMAEHGLPADYVQRIRIQSMQ